jgi:hypothetical protein
MVRYFLILAVLAVAMSAWSQGPSPSGGEVSQQKQSHPQTANQQSHADQRGTESAPLVVKILPTPNTQEESTNEAKDRAQESAEEGRLVELTGDLVVATCFLAGTGILQLFVFGYQAIQLRRTVEAASEQSKDMKESVAQAARTAKAMEDVAVYFGKSVAQAEQSTASFQERMAMQTRAYLSVIIGNAVFQDRAKNLRFQALPLVVNGGNTPARKVGHRSRAAILPVPLPDDFDFPLPEQRTGGSMVGAHQNATLNAIVDEFVNDAEVENIKKGMGKALHIWGIVYYEDIFGEQHETKFCQAITWLPDGKIWGFYIERFNDAT